MKSSSTLVQEFIIFNLKNHLLFISKSYFSWLEWEKGAIYFWTIFCKFWSMCSVAPSLVNRKLLLLLWPLPCSRSECTIMWGKNSEVKSTPFFMRNFKISITRHCVFLEHWNSRKSLCNIRQRFSCLLDEWI